MHIDLWQIQSAMTLETTPVYAVYLPPHGNPGVDCICSKIVTKCSLVPRLQGRSLGMRLTKCTCRINLVSFPGLQSPNAVEGLVKLVRRMTWGGRLEAWLIVPCMHNTAIHQKCHASRRPPRVILRRSFTRPSTALGDRRPGNEATYWVFWMTVV